MKWITSAAVAVMASMALAKPVAQGDPQAYGLPEDRRAIYQLRVKAKDYPEIHDRYLSISDEHVGIFSSRRPLVVSTTPREDSGFVSLHTYPIGIIDHVLALIGKGGLFDFKDTMPQLVDPTPESTYSWREFVLNQTSSTLLWQVDREGGWVVFPGPDQGTYEVKWNDGTGFTTQNYLPISIAFEAAAKPNRR